MGNSPEGLRQPVGRLELWPASLKACLVAVALAIWLRFLGVRTALPSRGIAIDLLHAMDGMPPSWVLASSVRPGGPRGRQVRE